MVVLQNKKIKEKYSFKDRKPNFFINVDGCCKINTLIYI